MPVSAGAYFMERGYEGQIASLQRHTFTKGTLEEMVNSTDSIIPFGRFVVEKTNGLPGELELPSASGQTLLGIATISDRFERSVDGTSGYPAKQSMAYLYKGVVWMLAETAMIRGGAVFVRHTASSTPGLHDAIGRIRNDADGNNADPLANVKVLENAIAGELVKLELDISPIQ